MIADPAQPGSLLALAVILALGTIPLHAVALRRAPAVDTAEHPHPSTSAGEALRSRSFWLLSGAFFLATGAAIAVLAALPAYGAERREPDASFSEVVRL